MSDPPALLSVTPEELSRTLVLHCLDWPVLALGHLPESPVAVVAGGKVIGATPAARSLGVRVGQRRKLAQSRCPELVVCSRDERAERRAFDRVLTALEPFGAPVATGHAGWAALRTRGPARYFGGEKRLAGLIGAELDRVFGAAPASADGSVTGDPGSPLVGGRWKIGIADGSFAARLAAVEGHIVAPGANAEYLAAFGIEVLHAPELTGLLGRLGIGSLGDFAVLGEGDVLARFGEEGAGLQRLAKGVVEHPLTFALPGHELLAELFPDPVIERVDQAAFAVRTLAQDLGRQLTTAGLACTVLEVRVALSDGEQLSQRWTHDGPFSVPLITERLRFQLEVFLLKGGGLEEESSGMVPRGITHLRLEAVEATADLGRTLRLWGHSGMGDERIERTFARLQGLAGPHAVLRPFLVGGRAPSERIVLVPYGEIPPESDSSLPWPGRLPAPSPAIVATVPFPVQVMDAEGEVLLVSARGALSAAPKVVVIDGHGQPVADWGGPWPSDERWWDAALHRRRARIQVLLESGQVVLLAVERGQWSLEGHYD